ncbi:antirepressor [Chryseobacterium sp. Leaf405]|uniref:M56 family metallopeptidase n=1 Tax=Chryseobacterium sp. Leaf405 TaxID=1736367 RepID=UPI0006FB9295|nr:M56 family metallopeptidase [Chryseobacterium sp. Leaf405]KQT31495.1 antirepressor [Chryseobacterium sp. Leaf405]
METVLIYLVKVILCSGVTFLYYQLSLKDKTFHHYNRFYLLSAMLISLLLPLVKIEDFTIQVSSSVYKLIDQVQNFKTIKNSDNDYIYLRIIFSALGLVSLYLLGKLIYGIFKIQKLKNQFKKEIFDGINFYQTNLTEAPFSYFRNLFWKNSITLNSEVGKQILKHEMVHIEQKHSFDKIFIEIITSVFWFNPFFHIIKKEISLIHEYLADKKAVQQSDTKAFAQMLLASHFSGKQLPATSPFLSSNLKKRLRMLQKPNTKFGYARRILALPVVFTVAFAYLVNAKNQEIKATNIEIEKAVSQIKKDTIVPNQNKNNVVYKTYKSSDEEKKVADLSKKIQAKSKALKELHPESKEFKKNVEEIGALSEEIEKIASSEDFVKGESNFKIIQKPKRTVDWESSYTTSIQFHDKDLPIPPTPPSPPKAIDAPFGSEVNMYSYTGSADMKWSTDGKLSAEKMRKDVKRNRKIIEIERKKAKLEAERAKLLGERASEIGSQAVLMGAKARQVAEQAMFETSKSKVYVYKTQSGNSNTSGGNSIFFNADNIKKYNDNFTMSGVKSFSYNGDDVQIYIDDKASTKDDMQALDSKNIERIDIKRNKQNDGKTSGEIRIQTKKK